VSETGSQKITWASRFMYTLNALSEEDVKRKTFSGLRIGMVLHIEAKTAVLALKIQEAGGEVYLAASNPLSTQDDVVQVLKKHLTAVWAKRGESTSEYYRGIRNILSAKPDFVIDDGADCITLSHKEGVDSIKGACEETTTGITRIRNLEAKMGLRYPIIAVNDAFTKHLFDNRFGSGQSVLDGLSRATNILIAGKNVVVVGYGWVGKGVALRLKGMGAKVAVSEVDPIKAIEAYMDGFDVRRLSDALRKAEIVITTTGNTKVISEKHFRIMRDGVLLANAGHFNVEIDVDKLEKVCTAKTTLRPNVVEYEYCNKKIYLLAEGRLVNLVAADGHPIEVMDMSFAGQFSALRYLVKGVGKIKPQLLPFPEELDRLIATTFLTSHGIKIDSLTPEQRRYTQSY